MSAQLVFAVSNLSILDGALLCAGPADGGVSVGGLFAPTLSVGSKDLWTECERLRANAPVVAGAVDSNYSVEAMPLSRFASNAVVDVGRGGTGSSNFDPGAPIMGSGADPIRSVPKLAVGAGFFSAPSVTLASGTIHPDTDVMGRSTLIANHTALGGPRVDLVNPMLSVPPGLRALAVTGAAVKAVLTAMDPLAFAVAIYPSGAADRTAAEVMAGYGADAHSVVAVTQCNNPPPGEPWPVAFQYALAAVLPRAPVAGEVVLCAARTASGLAAVAAAAAAAV